MNVFEQYDEIMLKAIETKLFTNDDLAANPLNVEFWIAAEKLARCIVSKNYSKTELIRTLNCWNYEDLISEFTLMLVRKFQTQIYRMLHPKPDKNGITHPHNHYAYTKRMFDNFIDDNLKRYEVKIKQIVMDANQKKHNVSVNVTTKGANGNDVKLYISKVSTATPITADGSLTLGDTLPSDTYNPELLAIKKNDEISARNETFEIFKKMFHKKKYLGSLYIYIADRLMMNGISCSLKSILEIFSEVDPKLPASHLAAQKALIKAYNSDLDRFIMFFNNNKISNDNSMSMYYAHSIEDFGRDFSINKGKISHLRGEYKSTIRKITRIDEPKKYTKKSKK